SMPRRAGRRRSASCGVRRRWRGRRSRRSRRPAARPTAGHRRRRKVFALAPLITQPVDFARDDGGPDHLRGPGASLHGEALTKDPLSWTLAGSSVKRVERFHRGRKVTGVVPGGVSPAQRAPSRHGGGGKGNRRFPGPVDEGGPAAARPDPDRLQRDRALAGGVPPDPQPQRRRLPLPVHPAQQRGPGEWREPLRPLGPRTRVRIPAVLLLPAPAAPGGGLPAPAALEAGGPPDALQPDAVSPHAELPTNRLLGDAADGVFRRV